MRPLPEVLGEAASISILKAIEQLKEIGGVVVIGHELLRALFAFDANWVRDNLEDSFIGSGSKVHLRRWRKNPRFAVSFHDCCRKYFNQDRIEGHCCNGAIEGVFVSSRVLGPKVICLSL